MVVSAFSRDSGEVFVSIGRTIDLRSEEEIADAEAARYHAKQEDGEADRVEPEKVEPQ